MPILIWQPAFQSPSIKHKRQRFRPPGANTGMCAAGGGGQHSTNDQTRTREEHTIGRSAHHGRASGCSAGVTPRCPPRAGVLVNPRAQLCFGSFVKRWPENRGARAYHRRVPGTHRLACFHVLVFPPFDRFYALWPDFQWRQPTGQSARPRDQGLDVVLDGGLAWAAVRLDGCALQGKRQASQEATAQPLLHRKPRRARGNDGCCLCGSPSQAH